MDKKEGKTFVLSSVVDYDIVKSEYLLKSLEEIVEFWNYWQEHGVGTILTLLSVLPLVLFFSR